MPAKPVLYLIDATATIHRAYHAIRGLSTSAGLPTNAVFGFTRMLIKLLQDWSPEYIAMCFDSKGKTFRHEMYPDYKATRPPMPEDMRVQLSYIREVSEGFRLPVIELPGFEADDLIGTLAAQAEKAGFSVVMVTGDKDFIQLVTETVSIWDPMKDKVTNLDEVRKTFALEPGQIIDVMGLSGDTSDNVPGVPGIGPKTALSLIQTFGSMAKVYENIDEVASKSVRQKLSSHKDQAFLSRSLVTIQTDVPLSVHLEDFRARTPDTAALAKLFKTLEFRQLQQEYPVPADLSQKSYAAVMTREELNQLVSDLSGAQIISLDTETTSEDPMRARLVGLSFSVTAGQAFYIPVGHVYPEAPVQLDLGLVLNALKPILENPEIPKVGQNIKYDAIVLARNGIHLQGIVFDDMVASYLINPSLRAHSLDQIALDHLNHKTITFQEVTGKGVHAGFQTVPIESATPYACEDADIALMVREVLLPKLESLGLTDLLERVEIPLIKVLMRMEMRGVCVDRDRLRLLSKSFESQLADIETRIYAAAGETFNIQSHQQLGQILFEKLKLPSKKKTKKKTGYSTDVEVLNDLAIHHELPDLVLRHRTLSKLKSTYTDALLDLVHPETGRIHTSYNQTVAVTGRLSSSDPNLQNIPIRTEEGRQIRSAFIPQEGWIMVSADYSQIELRILAHCSEDPLLIDAFIKDEDIHSRTASEVFGGLPGMLTPELRRQAKIINFGILYGMGAFSLSRELGISQKMAKAYIDQYFKRYRGVRDYTEQTIALARQTQKTSTLLGRIRLLPDINSQNSNVRSFSERIAVNTPLQGTAADLIKLAMIQMDADFSEKGFQAAMLMTVHDELVFEVPEQELEAVTTRIRDIMEGVWQLKVPLKVNIASGKNWAEAH
ncbi:MAG: DNA polymerase I [Deltaproteobacteria bacterium]|nr:DNA polymerase I [Deltaproteobacteria bacterium]